MGFSVNKVTLLGRLGNDPETKNLTDGTAITTMSIATDQSYKDQDGEWKSKTDWHRVTAWNKLAETCGKHLKKGSKIYMEGSIHTKQYEKDGVKKYVTEIRMSQLVMLDSKKDGQTNTETSDAPPVTEDVNGDLPF